MEIDEIFSLMDRAEKSAFSKIEIQTQDFKLCLERQAAAHIPAAIHHAEAHTAPKKDEQPAPSRDDDCIVAPISGVFYVAKEPGAAPFVKEGQCVREGDTVCIIEAMKMMNEIGAPKTGVIERVLLGDGEAVTVGDALFVYAKES